MPAGARSCTVARSGNPSDAASARSLLALGMRSSMHLVQILLPVYTRGGARQPGERFEAVERELTDAFGGLTTYLRSPAHGRWRNAEGDVEHDEVVVCEAMVEELDHEWWARYRSILAARFEQEDLVVRATAIETL